MPLPNKTPMNPNDANFGGYLQKKRQFYGINQHYISHKDILREDLLLNGDYNDPYKKIPLKPNQISYETSKAIYEN